MPKWRKARRESLFLDISFSCNDSIIRLIILYGINVINGVFTYTAVTFKLKTLHSLPFNIILVAGSCEDARIAILTIENNACLGT